MGELFTAASTLGVCSMLVIYFVWEGRERERRVEKRLTASEDYIRKELKTMNETMTAALNRSSDVIESFVSHCKCDWSAQKK